jgi:hypothetical protein
VELKLEAVVEIEPQSVRLSFTCCPHHLRPDPIKQNAGTSSVFDMNDWTFINADLTVSLGREPVGEWVLLDAETWIGPDSVGIAAARLADRQGYFGRAVQSIIFEKR